MKCTCSLNKDYNIIGLCDIKTFNDKINDFKDNSWSQIIVSKKIQLPSSKPPIENITKVYLNIKINSSKIIKTPSSDLSNVEGLILTGKLLLISGNICENIIYTSDTLNNSVHSLKFNIPFSTYIIVDKDSDLKNDYFCIFHCVEDVFITPLNQRAINNNVTLFLFAHKTLLIDPKKLPNLFIFKNLNDEEMVIIEFNKDDMKLIVTSTNKTYGGGNRDIAFRFELKNSDKSVTKVSGIILENGNANNFQDTLDGFTFKNGDKIVVFLKDNNKLTLSNSKNQGENYDIPSAKDQDFEINVDAIRPVLTLNKIIVKSQNNEEVLNISFIKDAEKFFVSSTEIIPDSSSNETYFTLILKDENGNTLLKSTLNSNETANKFKSNINNRNFLFSKNSLTLIYKDKTKVEILNYPNQGNTYIPTSDFNIFLINPNSLEDIALNSSIKFISENNKEMSSLYFTKAVLIPSYTTISTSTQVISTNALQNNEKYLEYLSYSEISTISYGEILGRENAERFSNSLDSKNIQINPINILRLSNRLPNRIIIKNYNGQDEYKIRDEPEFLEIRQNLLTPHNLNYNKIRLKNINNSTILFVYFDKITSNTIYIEPYSTGIVNTDSETFSFKITDTTESNIKLQGIINKGENADVLVNTFGIQPYNISKDFNIGDLLILEYSNRNLIEIFDFQVAGNIYNPTGFSQKFTINENGLNPFVTPVLKNAFIFNNLNNEEMVKIEFGKNNNRLVVTSTDKNYGGSGTDVAFNFEVNNSIQTNNKTSAIIKENENSFKFRSILNNFKFENNAKITVLIKDNSKLTLTNFPNQGDSYNVPANQSQSFLIGQNSISPVLTPNKITIKSKTNQEVLTINFIKDAEKFLVSSTTIIPDSSSNEPYFTLILKDETGSTLLKSTLNSNESADAFNNIINNKDFKFSSNILALIYTDKTKIEISNYPNQGDTYIPNLDFNIFSIKPTTLEDISIISNIKIINDANKEISNLYFAKSALNSSYTTITTSTQDISTTLLQNNEKYIQYLRYSQNPPISYAEILGKENATNFSNALDGDNISIIPINILKLFNRLENRIIITNYKSQDEYRVEKEPEFLQINQNSLAPHNLNYNKIRLKNIDNSTILFIYFDKLSPTTIYIQPYSTGIINNDSDNFSFKVTDPTETNIKLQSTINKGDTADSLVNTFATASFNISKDFDIGDTLILECSNKNLVEIFDFETIGNIYNLNYTLQKFAITENGLVDLTNKLSNAFIFKNLNDEKIAKIEFDITHMKLVVNSTNKNYGGADDSMAFEFELMELNEYENIEIISARINKNSDANIFKDSLNGYDFKFDYMAFLSFNDNTKVILTNYPKQGENYTMISNSVEAFKITANGLVSDRLPNSIILNDINNEPIITLQFDLDFKTFSVNSTGKKTNPSGKPNYFTITLYNADGVTSELTSTLLVNTDGSSFKSSFNDQLFAFGKILKIECAEKEKVLITNFPNSSDTPYNPTEVEEWFEITNTGLKKYNQTTSQFLQNVILFKNFSNEIMNTFRFDKASMKLIVTSTGLNYGNIGDDIALRFQINGIDSVLFQNITGDIFEIILNNASFNFGDEVILEYDQPYMLEITNFPNLGDSIYIPKNKKEETFEITGNGLVFKQP